jgi:hypothetical protein
MHAWFHLRRAGTLLVLALALGSALPLHARLGETEAQSIARYGAATATVDADQGPNPYRTLKFFHAGYAITAQFLDGKCALICFQKPEDAEFSADDLDLLMKSEVDGKAWVRSALVSIDLIWNRPDGAMARYDTTNHAFAFCSAAYLRAEQTRKSAVKARQLNDL